MRYQRIYTSIWHDEKVKRLSAGAKLLFLYLLAAPHSNLIGLFQLPFDYIKGDLSLGPRALERQFKELNHARVIQYSEEDKLIWVPNHLKHNPISNEPQAKGAARIVKTLPRSPFYREIYKQMTKPYHAPLKKLLAEKIEED